MEYSKDPLKCEIVEKRLVISIGIDTLAFSATLCPKLLNEHQDPVIKIIDTSIFAEDVKSELEKIDCYEKCLLTDMLDEAIFNAVENGSLGTEEK